MSIYETAPTGLALQEQKRRKHLNQKHKEKSKTFVDHSNIKKNQNVCTKGAEGRKCGGCKVRTCLDQFI
jgi:hypothetical protein